MVEGGGGGGGLPYLPEIETLEVGEARQYAIHDPPTFIFPLQEVAQVEALQVGQLHQVLNVLVI